MSRRYGCTETVIHKALVRTGVALRPRGQVSPYRTDPTFIKRVLELWGSGKTISTIVQELKVGPNPVSRIIQDHGGTNNTKAKRERHGMWKGGVITHPVSGYVSRRLAIASSDLG